MENQKEIFATAEGDQWFLRNQESYKKNKNENGTIIQSLQDLEIKPKKILEIGCSNGTRLHNFNVVFGAECFGIDPSTKAIENGKKEYPSIVLQVGTADALPFADNSFDVIIFGFCLTWCDRKLLFKIASEADRCLSDNGYMIINDFYPSFSYKNVYTHTSGVFSYKMDHAKMFSWNPVYTEIFNTVFTHGGFEKRNNPDEKVAITILSKNETFAYPLEPFKK